MKLARVISLSLVLALSTLTSQSDGQSLTLERVVSGLANPTFVTYAPGDGDRLYIAQRSGAIRILNLNTGNLNGSNFMTVPGVSTTGEGGLLGLAFHPDFENNGFFYVNYTTNSGGFRTRVSRFTATNSDSASSATQQVVLEVAQPFSNHNAGWIGFSPLDNYLYVTMGDGGSGNDPGNRSQDITNQLLGKMLRLDIDGDDFPSDANRNYAIPADNPFVGVTGDDEIYLYGLRNPFRSSFDRDTGDLYIGDVGQGAREEVDLIPAGYEGGMNLGWRLREGTIATPGVGGGQPADGLNPIYDYVRTGAFGGFSLTGGVVYRGPVAALQGNYFFADFGSNNFWSFSFDGSEPGSFNGNNVNDLTRWNGIFTTSAGFLNSIVGFGEDLAGNVYIVDFGGEIFRIDDGAITDPPIDVALNIVAPSMGTVESGTNKDLAVSDDNDLRFRAEAANQGQPSIQVEFFGTSPETDISEFVLNFESQVNSANYMQTIEFFNYVTNQFDVVDKRSGSLSDEAISISIDNDAFRYVFATGLVRTRVTITATGPIFAFPGLLDVDQFSWQVFE